MRRSQRLRGRRRFLAVRTGGAECRAPAVRARALGNGRDSARVGIAVSGARGAVERNRARRRLRAAACAVVDDLGGVDVVLSASADVAGIPYAQLQSTVREIVSFAVNRTGAA